MLMLPKGLPMSQTCRVLARCIACLLGAILLFSAVGCDDDDDAVFVDFSVSCSTVSCFNVDEIGSFFDDDGTEHRFCTWYCGNFNDLSEVFVDLVFERPPGGCFELESEFIADGGC
jgi:hypothetical protein